VEVTTAVEPLKQLPQLVAAAAARVAAAAAAQQQQQLMLELPPQQQQQQQEPLLLEAGGEYLEAQAVPMAAAGAAAVAVGGRGVFDQGLLLQEFREAVAAEVSAATQQILAQQVRC